MEKDEKYGETIPQIDFDTFSAKIGEFGRYQRIRFYLICATVCFYCPFPSPLVFVFSAPDGYRCRTPTENSSQKFFPIFSNKTENENREFCDFSLNVTENFTIKKSCDFGYVYEFYESPRESLVTEWDLVCDRSWIIGTIYLFLTIGGMFFVAVLKFMLYYDL